jgi:hypothetical protein
MKYLVGIITLNIILLVGCSKEKEEPITEQESTINNCHPANNYQFSLNDEQNGFLPGDTLSIFSIPTYIIFPRIITPNNDGYNDHFTYEPIPSVSSDSSMLIVKDGCGRVVHDSRFDWFGPTIPLQNHVGWPGYYLPDSAAWHNQPWVDVPSGVYNYEFTIWFPNFSTPIVWTSVIELSRPV